MSQADSSSIGARLVRNTLHAAAGRVAAIVVGLLLVPWLLTSLGSSRFGEWVLALAVASHAEIFVGGVRVGLIRMVADRHLRAEEDPTGIGRAVSAYVLLSALSALLSLGLLVTFAPALASLIGLDGSAGRWSGGGGLIAAAALASATRPLLGTWEPLLLGLQRFGSTSTLGAVRSLLWGAIALAVVLAGQGPLGLILGDLTLSLVMAVPGLWVARARLGGLGPSLAQPARADLQELFHYGAQLSVSTFAGVINRHSDKLIVGAFIDPAIAGALEVGQQVAVHLRSVIGLLVPALLPAAPELARQGPQVLRDTLLRAQKVVNLAALLLLLPASALAVTALSVWLGPSQHPPEATLTLRFLAPAFLFGATTMVGAEFARGLARLEVEVRSSLIYTVVALPLKLALAAGAGLVGLLSGAVTALALADLYVLVALAPILHYRVGVLMRETLLRPLIATGIAVACACVADRFLPLPALPPVLGERTAPAARLVCDSLVLGGAFLIMVRLVLWRDADLRRALEHLRARWGRPATP